MTADAPTLDTPRPALAARLWFGYVLLANALVVLAMYLPAMAHLKRSHTVRTFQRWARPWSQTALALAGIRVQAVLADGADQAPDGPVVYVANHQAMVDIPVLLVAIRAPFLFVARSGLARVPLIGSVLSTSVCVFLDRSRASGGAQALAAAEARLALGESVLFFPEGTRRYAGPPGAFFPGAFRLAQRAGVPVVPVAIGGAFRLANERDRTARPGRVRVAIGRPIPSDATPDRLAEQAHTAVAQMLTGL